MRISARALPIMHMVEDDNGDFCGIALMSAEDFQGFLRDHNIDSIALKIVNDNKVFPVPYRMAYTPSELPHFTMQYRHCFIEFKEQL